MGPDQNCRTVEPLVHPFNSVPMPTANRALLLLMLLGAAGQAPAKAQTASISGRISDKASGLPVERATVSASLGQIVVRTAATNADGRYQLTGLSAGRYTVAVTRIGLQLRRSDPVDVAPGATATLDFETSPLAARLDEVVTTASRRQERSIDAPASTAVVTEQQIESRVALTTSDHVRGLPGVDVSSGGLVQANVVTRGFNNIFSGQLLTLTDYRFSSVPSLRVNVPYLVPTTNEDIERIEVVLGPGAALYGPNSANGVLHVITKSPFESEGTTLTLGGGERSVMRGAMRHATRLNDKFAFKISGDWLRGDDWKSTDPIEPATTVRDFDVRRWSADARIDVRPTPGLEWTTSYGRSVAGRALEPTGTSGMAQVKNWTYSTAHTRVHRGRFFAQAFANLSDAGDTQLLRTGSLIVDQSQLFVGQIQHGAALTRRIDLTVGADGQRTVPRTSGTINGRNESDDDVTEIGGYGHVVAHATDNIDLSVAGRLDHNSRLSGTVFSPRAAIVYKPAVGQSFRLTFNSAFTTPSNFNLFLDLPSGAIPFGALGGYRIVALGVPKTGFHFRRDCSGLCMRSPFAAIPGGTADPTAFLEADATLRWRTASEIAIAQNPALAFLRALPAPTKASVSSNLGLLDVTTKAFRRVTAADVLDVEALQPTHNNAVEAGYKGFVGSRLQLAVDVWHEARRNFIGPSLVETPNVFLDSTTTAQYLAQFVPAGTAQAVAGGLAKIPVGTISPDQALANSPGPDIIVTYRNYGKLNVWGSDFSGELLVTDQLSLLGTYSWVNRDLFPRSEVGGLADVTLNAPANKASGTARFRDQVARWGGDLRVRYVDAFPVQSGVFVGDVSTYTLLDGSLDFAVPQMEGLRFAVTGTNLLNKLHREFVGVPEIGRLILTQLKYSF